MELENKKNESSGTKIHFSFFMLYVNVFCASVLRPSSCDIVLREGVGVYVQFFCTSRFVICYGSARFG